ncbi:MAG: hypothetical protein FWF59_00235 [Turicibacter sp.]|nr:hypothetical protein [Turicibacter sp.]
MGKRVAKTITFSEENWLLLEELAKNSPHTNRSRFLEYLLMKETNSDKDNNSLEQVKTELEKKNKQLDALLELLAGRQLVQSAPASLLPDLAEGKPDDGEMTEEVMDSIESTLDSFLNDFEDDL